MPDNKIQSQNNKPNPRMIAFKVLMRVEGRDGYSNISLNEALLAFKPEPRDRAFITRLVYGVLEKTEYLDHVISSYTSRGTRIEPEVRCILRMAVYQMAFMNTPDSAAVNESVNLAKKLKLFRATGFLNGLLRSFIRDGKQVKLPDPAKQADQYLSIQYSCPLWLVRLWHKSYGSEICEKILASLEGRPPIYLKVNTTRVSTDALLKEFQAAGVKASASEIIPDCVSIEETGDITLLPAFQNGYFHVQDASSQLCCMAAAAGMEGGVVYDVCAAPGGKSFSIAELMGDRGRIISCDLHPHRVELIAQGAGRLGLHSIEPTVRDALGECEPECADLVLCDAPCSGLGIIRRKPDIKRKPQAELQGLPDLQYRILENSSRLVRKGGRLIYSTCTLNPAENAAVIEKFLQNHREFEPCPQSLADEKIRAIDEPDWQITLFPHMFNTDGFFISSVRRKD